MKVPLHIERERTMDDQAKDVGSTPVPGAPVEGWMLREDVVREVLARMARGDAEGGVGKHDAVRSQAA